VGRSKVLSITFDRPPSRSKVIQQLSTGLAWPRNNNKNIGKRSKVLLELSTGLQKNAQAMNGKRSKVPMDLSTVCHQKPETWQFPNETDTLTRVSNLNKAI
jgi:hypothetical protein